MFCIFKYYIIIWKKKKIFLKKLNKNAIQDENKEMTGWKRDLKRIRCVRVMFLCFTDQLENKGQQFFFVYESWMSRWSEQFEQLW